LVVFDFEGIPSVYIGDNHFDCINSGVDISISVDVGFCVVPSTDDE